MTGFQGQVPAGLLGAAAVAVLFGAALTFLLGWHLLRRLLDVPRVPRPGATYLTLSTLWVALVGTSVGAITMIALLRNHHRVDGRTPLADVRCEVVAQNQLKVELVPSSTSKPQSHVVPGHACVVWVKQVEVRPGLVFLGARALSRIDGVGPNAPSQRSLADRIAGVVVRRTEVVPLMVPPDAHKRSIVVSAPGGPALEPPGPALTGL
jgi:hypothetical protein